MNLNKQQLEQELIDQTKEVVNDGFVFLMGKMHEKLMRPEFIEVSNPPTIIANLIANLTINLIGPAIKPGDKEARQKTLEDFTAYVKTYVDEGWKQLENEEN